MTRRRQLIEEITHGFHTIGNVIKNKLAGLSHKKGVTHSQWFVLMLIGHAGPIGVKGLSEILDMSSSAVTQFVDVLVRNGYVTRCENPIDRRSIQLEITLKGKRHISNTKEMRIAEMESLFDTLTDQELEQLALLQNKISANVSQRRP